MDGRYRRLRCGWLLARIEQAGYRVDLQDWTCEGTITGPKQPPAYEQTRKPGPGPGSLQASTVATTSHPANP